MTVDNNPKCKLRFEVKTTPRSSQETKVWTKTKVRQILLETVLVIVAFCIGCLYLAVYFMVTMFDLEHWWKFSRAYFADPPTLSPESIAISIRTTKYFLIAFYSIALFGALRASLQIPKISWIPLILLAVLTHVVHNFMIRCFTKYLKHLLYNKVASNLHLNPTSTFYV